MKKGGNVPAAQSRRAAPTAPPTPPRIAPYRAIRMKSSPIPMPRSIPARTCRKSSPSRVLPRKIRAAATTAPIIPAKNPAFAPFHAVPRAIRPATSPPIRGPITTMEERRNMITNPATTASQKEPARAIPLTTRILPLLRDKGMRRAADGTVRAVPLSSIRKEYPRGGEGPGGWSPPSHTHPP